ncbi:MAG: hypothetical protein KDC71_03920 [Acidobacteria bacterium]|nr:hypothetical protein [Acidobacteriota bacterium]
MQLSQLLDHQHRGLSQLLTAHCEALLCMDPDAAQHLFHDFQLALSLHIQLENEKVLTHLPPTSQWPKSLYRAEHTKLLEITGKYGEQVEKTWPQDAHTRRLHILGLLESAFRIAHLSEHHHQREEKDMIPLLNDLEVQDPAQQLAFEACLKAASAFILEWGSEETD